MSSIGAVSGNNAYVPPQQTSQPPKQAAPDHSGDAQANQLKASDAMAAAKEAQHKVDVHV
jgi:hypothetical protein